MVAHRGSNGALPEHSLAAYRRAIEEGADALECDVRLTSDGQLVLVHDRRIDRVSTGSGAVSRQTLGELAAHAFGGEWDGEPREADRASVLTLGRLIALAMEAPRPVALAIETKHPVRYSHYVEEALVETLRSFGLLRPDRQGRSLARVMSFSELAIGRMQRLAPAVPRVQLVDIRPFWRLNGSMPNRVFAAGLSIELLRKRPEYVRRVQSRGYELHVWTVDEFADVDLCVSFGAKAIITNRPGEVVQYLARVHSEAAIGR